MEEFTEGTKTAGKCANSASSLYWRSVEDENGIQFETCGSACNRINHV